MITVETTLPGDDATEMARELVEAGAAACVHLHDVESIYRWQGEVVEEHEVALKIKTALSYEEIQEEVVERHPYEVPMVLRRDVDGVNDGYLEWVRDVSRRA
ncbi:MAG: divalent-cation tolerance protein CutA [Halobacteriales archaeon]